MTSRDRGVRAVAAAAVVSGLTSALVVAVPGTRGLHLGGGFARDQVTVYGPAHAALAVGLLVTGLVLAVARSSPPVVAALGVIGLCSSQLAGVGLVAIRRWPLYWGCCSVQSVEHQQLMRLLALVMAVVCAVTAVACLVALIWQRRLEWQGWTASLAIPIAVVELVAVPRRMATSTGYVNGDVRDLVAAAVTYSVPFATALVISAYLRRPAALVVVGAVAGSAVIGVAGEPFLDASLPYADAQWLAVGAALVTGLTRLLPERAAALDDPA